MLQQRHILAFACADGPVDPQPGSPASYDPLPSHARPPSCAHRQPSPLAASHTHTQVSSCPAHHPRITTVCAGFQVFFLSLVPAHHEIHKVARENQRPPGPRPGALTSASCRYYFTRYAYGNVEPVPASDALHPPLWIFVPDKLARARLRSLRPNGEWGYSTRRQCWATSAQQRCHLEEALYLPTFSHLF